MAITKPKTKSKTLKEKVESNLSYKTEMDNAIKEIIEIKTMDEANIVSMLWKDPKLLEDYQDEIKTSDFDNLEWGAFYEILYQLTIVERKEVLDETTIGSYLSQHKKLLQTWTTSGGLEAIKSVGTYVDSSNLESCIKSFHKWQKIKKLAEYGYPINNRLSEFKDKQAEDIYDEYEAYLNDIFANEDFGIQSYDVTDGIYELIDKLNKGEARGIAYKNMPMFTEATNGMLLGNITLLGGVSNAGKSTFLRSTILPSIIDAGERIVIFLNEEGVEKWQREFIIWVSNNIFSKTLTKNQLKNGNFTPEILSDIKEAVQWIEQCKNNHTITLIPLEKYKTSTVVKLIKKYSSLNVKYFAIDTFKMDNADGYQVNDNTRLQMVQNMTNLYNTIKESCKNVHLICTVQLNKASARTRYLALDNIGESKNIVDVCSSAFFIRNLTTDEIAGKDAINVWRMGGTNNRSQIPVKLEDGKQYQVIFIAKSREGAAGVGSKQIVIETDYSRNLIKEIGYTFIPSDSTTFR